MPLPISVCVDGVLGMLWTDTLMLGRVEDLYATDLERAAIGSPEFCEYKLQSYFTDNFWANRTLSQKFENLRDACYFNPGVLVINVPAWRAMKATQV
jgi:lipopolysaccharide biosynthesis glycosyltransferase